MLRILVIGGTRFIGPYVVRRLIALGHDVTVYHRGRTETALPPEVRHVHSDLARIPIVAFPDEIKHPAPDVVLHMVHIGERDAQAVMSTYRSIAHRIVGISSGDVYRAYGVVHRTEPGPLQPMPLTENARLRQQLYPSRGKTPRGEDDPENWLDDYEKILVERAIMADPDLPGTMLRLPFVYGPHDGRLFEYLKRMDDKRPAILIGEGLAQFRGTWGYVENVAAAIALAVTDERAEGRIYNVGEPDPPSMSEWVRRLGEAAGWEGEVVVVPEEHLPVHLAGGDSNWDQHLVTDTTRIRQELGYAEPVLKDQALRCTLEWQRANPVETDPEQFDYTAEDRVLAELERSLQT